MNSLPLDIFPLWVQFTLTVCLLAVGLEVGYRSGQWRRAMHGEKDQPVSAIVASTLGLVALVLGFTFSLAASRFDARRQVVLEEANAIGTTYLRTQFLPEPQRAEVQSLLREYVDVRLAAPNDPAKAVVKSEAIQAQLWERGSLVAQQQPESIMVGLFIQSLNDVIDIHAKRVLVGLRSRIPMVIWVGVIGLAFLGILEIGYQSGLSGTRRSPSMIGLILAFAVVLNLIADLDRGHEGLLLVSQQAMSDLKHTITAPP